MTDRLSPTIDFMRRLKMIDAANLKAKDILILWAVAREGGMSGLELSKKLGYPSRSNVQIGMKRLLEHEFIEDRRKVKNQLTPNDLYILPAGEKFLADIVPV